MSQWRSEQNRISLAYLFFVLKIQNENATSLCVSWTKLTQLYFCCVFNKGWWERGHKWKEGKSKWDLENIFYLIGKLWVKRIKIKYVF